MGQHHMMLLVPLLLLLLLGHHQRGAHAHVDSSSTAAYIANERLLRALTDACAARRDTVLQLDATGALQELPSLLPDAPCPALDIALRGAERGVGMCTDAALYVLHFGSSGRHGAGARILPLLGADEMSAYTQRCGRTTARMFLESMYREWIAPPGSGTLHLMLVNSEHMFRTHASHHAAMDVFLCKTQVCQALVWQYVTETRLKGEVWCIGHTSSDVTVLDDDTSGAAADGQHSSSSDSSSGAAVAGSAQQPDFSRFLHVKGKSGLKHTGQLLECWAGHPEFPPLTVIGQVGLGEPRVQDVLSGRVANIRLLPRPGADAAATRAVDGMARRLAEAAARTNAAAKRQPLLLPAAPHAATQPPPAPVQQQQQLAPPAAHAQRAQAEEVQPEVSAASLLTPEFEESRAKVHDLLALLGRPVLADGDPAAAAEDAAADDGGSSSDGGGGNDSTPAVAAGDDGGAAAGQPGPEEQQQHQPAMPAAAPHPQQQPATPVPADDYLSKPLLDVQQQQQQDHGALDEEAARATSESEHPPMWPDAGPDSAGEQQQQPHGVLGTSEFHVARARLRTILATLGQSLPSMLPGDDEALDGSHHQQQQQHRRRLLASSSDAAAAGVSVQQQQVHALAERELMWTPPLLQQDQLISFADIRAAQAGAGVHIAASEREGFGHYLNEARAAGALVITTDHPPMNELITPATGVLIPPPRTSSYPEWQALGGYAPLNAFLTPNDICAAVQRALAMPLEERAARGAAARQQYLLEKAVFQDKVAVLRRFLARRRRQHLNGAAAAAAAGGADGVGPAEEQQPQQQRVTLPGGQAGTSID